MCHHCHSQISQLAATLYSLKNQRERQRLRQISPSNMRPQNRELQPNRPQTSPPCPKPKQAQERKHLLSPFLPKSKKRMQLQIITSSIAITLTLLQWAKRARLGAWWPMYVLVHLMKSLSRVATQTLIAPRILWTSIARNRQLSSHQRRSTTWAILLREATLSNREQPLKKQLKMPWWRQRRRFSSPRPSRCQGVKLPRRMPRTLKCRENKKVSWKNFSRSSRDSIMKCRALLALS